MPLRNIHLTPQLVQAVRDAVDIVAIASDHTRLQKAGSRYKGLCPLHKEKTPSFSVEPNQGLFYCFGCGRGGDAIKLHMLLTGDDFPGAIEALARQLGIPLPSRPSSRREPTRRSLESVLEAAQEYFVAQLARVEEPRAYLEERQIPGELVERFGLGYAPPGWRNLVGALHPRIPLEDLVAAGLVGRSERSGGKPYDRFRQRLIFPIRNAAGRLVGFGGRALGEDRAKYINTAETEQFHKGSLLYGLDQAKRQVREKGKALLVEGYTDVLAAFASGIDWAVANMGTALSGEQARLLRRYADEAVIAYDGDEAGERAFRRALQVLLGEGLTVTRVAMPEGLDPDALRLEQGPEALARQVEAAPDAVSLELARLIPTGAVTQPRLRARAAREAAELLKPIGDGVLRYAYAREAGDRLGVPVEVFWRRLARGPEPSGPPPEQEEAPPSPVRSREERVLQLLLSEEVEVPALEDLPPEEAFMDPVSRNIFSVFRDLYEESGGVPPKARDLLAALAAEGSAVDRVAGLLLEDSAHPCDPGELGGCLQDIKRRWQKQRLRRLSSEIQEAERSGDRARRDRLSQEMEALSRARHGRA